MCILVRVVLVTVIFFVTSALALNQEAQVDILMSKSVRALKDNRNSDALASMEQLMSMEGSLSKPLPEGFEYLYIETLDKVGNTDKALERANKYVDKYGTKSKNYGKVIEIIGRLEEVSEKKRKETEQANIKECIKIADNYCNYHQQSMYFSNINDNRKSNDYSSLAISEQNRWKNNGCDAVTPTRYSHNMYVPIQCN